MTPSSPATDPRVRAEKRGRAPGLARTLRIAVGLFAVGLVFIAIDVIPFFFGSTDHPLWLNLACLCAPAGFVLAVVSAWRAGRATQRAALADIGDGT